MVSRSWKCLLVALLLCFPGLVFCNDYEARLDSILERGIRDTVTLNKANKLIESGMEAEGITDSLIITAHAVLEQARHLKYDPGIADALLNLVKCYLNRYESTKSLEYALEGYSLYEEQNNKAKMAYMLLQIGIIYYTQNNFSKSLEYYNNSVTEFEKVGDQSYIGTLYYLSGINYSKLKNYASALTFFNRAKKIKTELNDVQGLAECNIGLAELYLGMQVPDTALLYLGMAQHYTSETGNTYGMAKGNILAAEAHFQKSNYDTARTFAMKGMRLANSINARELMMDASRILYRISEGENDFRNAYKHVLNFMNMRDSIINEKTSRKMSRMEGDYIIEKKQSEILLLEKENRNRTILLRASVIIGILALLLSLLYYNKHQMKQKANQKLQKAYHELETTQQQLIQQEKLASLGQLTAGIAHEIKNPLNFVNNFSLLSVELLRELRSIEDRAEREALLNDISTNIEKIAHHGERANSIVTRMLEHSRTGKRELELTDINRLIKEYLHLAYQAVRIKNPDFPARSPLPSMKRFPC